MTTMKTDTEEAIRVTITLRRESHPEWYDRLVDVKSGRARADIVRTHLTLPRAVSTTTRQPRADIPTTQAGQEPVAVETPAIVAPKPSPAKSEIQATSSPSSAQASSSSGGLAGLMHGKFGDNGAFSQS